MGHDTQDDGRFLGQNRRTFNVLIETEDIRTWCLMQAYNSGNAVHNNSKGLRRYGIEYVGVPGGFRKNMIGNLSQRQSGHGSRNVG